MAFYFMADVAKGDRMIVNISDNKHVRCPGIRYKWSSFNRLTATLSFDGNNKKVQEKSGRLFVPSKTVPNVLLIPLDEFTSIFPFSTISTWYGGVKL